MYVTATTQAATTTEDGRRRAAECGAFPDLAVLGILASVVSIISFLYFFRHNTLLLYGDAVAHLNIARRIFDSRNPGPLQLGTVWLPLPHLLMLPFVVSRWMWHTGVGGAIPSMLAYLAGALGLFRLVRRTFHFADVAAGPARLAAWLAAVIFMANPNLLYLQATAMTEPLYLALIIWATVFFSDFVQHVREGSAAAARPPLTWCGVLLALAMLTRYDGWFAGAAFGATALAIRTGGLVSRKKFLVVVAAVPVLWLAYNAAIFGNPLEFATGPYSAKGIERRTASPGMPHHPGYHSMRVAALYFLKDTRLNLGDRDWQKPWLLLAVMGSLLVLASHRRLWPLLLLWLPLPFYALSISRGGVPIFFPDWYPFSYYNVRYGLQLLPAIAVFTSVVIAFLVVGPSWARAVNRGGSSHFWRSTRASAIVTVAAIAFVGLSYGTIWQNPICLREARANSLTRVSFEQKLAAELVRLPDSATVLMETGAYGGALQRAGIPLRRTINETSYPFWKQALADPAQFADYAIAFGQDAVWSAVKSEADRFEPLMVVESRGVQATIYRRRQPAQNPRSPERLPSKPVGR